MRRMTHTNVLALRKPLHIVGATAELRLYLFIKLPDMANEGINWIKIFIGFGVVAVLSGIYLIFQKDYVGGISGAMVGLLLIFLNMQKTKDANE